jgi:hypothetical protein
MTCSVTQQKANMVQLYSHLRQQSQARNKAEEDDDDRSIPSLPDPWLFTASAAAIYYDDTSVNSNKKNIQNNNGKGGPNNQQNDRDIGTSRTDSNVIGSGMPVSRDYASFVDQALATYEAHLSWNEAEDDPTSPRPNMPKVRTTTLFLCFFFATLQSFVPYIR